MFAPWRSQKSLHKHKDPITGNSFTERLVADCKEWNIAHLSMPTTAVLRVLLLLWRFKATFSVLLHPIHETLHLHYTKLFWFLTLKDVIITVLGFSATSEPEPQ